MASYLLLMNIISWVLEPCNESIIVLEDLGSLYFCAIYENDCWLHGVQRQQST